MFYLTSHDYITTPEPRVCNIIDDCVVKETGRRLIRISLTPSLPGELVGISGVIESLLLGQIDMRLKLSDIGKSPFMVDIFYLKTPHYGSECTTSALVKIGCGLLHSQLADAIDASPMEK